MVRALALEGLAAAQAGPGHGLGPINPSPWYAFRYAAAGEAPVTVHLRYLEARHRYAPVLTDAGGTRGLVATVGQDRKSATLQLPAGEATVSAQELFGKSRYHTAMQRWAKQSASRPLTLGRSHDGRAIEALRLGNEDAPRLVVLLGRAHPPEVTGAIAMEAFVDRIAALVSQKSSLAERYQFLVLPQMNPDGVARGHWRANLGGTDLNRDWGEFTQPETSAVKRWLDALPHGVRPVAMIDFHSTDRNLFYVQGAEATAAQRRFLEAWLTGRERSFAGYPFTIEPRNANPGSGTSKNWFHATYAIPAYTYEVDDNADRAVTRAAATALANALPAALDAMAP